MASSIVIIPTYNERNNIERLINLILEQDEDIHVLIVDDSSPDGTGDVVRYKMEGEPRVLLIEREGKQGLGTAYVAGFKYALKNRYSFILTMDADFSHDPKKIPQLLKAVEGADVSIGSRYINDGGIENWPLYRRLLSFFANLAAKSAMGGDVKDCTSGFRCYRKEVIESFDLEKIFSQGYSCLVELLFKIRQKGYRIKEVPILFADRKHGKSKIGKKEIYKGMFTVLKIAHMRLFGVTHDRIR